jgi:hypothetical protein
VQVALMAKKTRAPSAHSFSSGAKMLQLLFAKNGAMIEPTELK